MIIHLEHRNRLVEDDQLIRQNTDPSSVIVVTRRLDTDFVVTLFHTAAGIWLRFGRWAGTYVRTAATISAGSYQRDGARSPTFCLRCYCLFRSPAATHCCYDTRTAILTALISYWRVIYRPGTTFARLRRAFAGYAFLQLRLAR